MERYVYNHRPLPLTTEYLALVENTEQYENFLDFYRTHCFPTNGPTINYRLLSHDLQSGAIEQYTSAPAI